MTRAERIVYAFTRYGRIDPTPDDVLSAHWTRYASGDRIHIEGYHHDFAEVMRRVVASQPRRECRVCGDELTTGGNGTGNRNRRYCSPKCVKAAQRTADKRRYWTPATKLTDAERERCVELYQVGYSLKDVSAQVGRAPSAVRGALLTEGVKLRPNRGQRPMTSAIRRGMDALYASVANDHEEAA